MTMGEPQEERYRAFEIIRPNGEASDITTAELHREIEKRKMENVFPFEVFHPSARNFMQLIHTHMDIPRSYIGLNMLSVYSSAIGTAYAVRRGGRDMYMSMWSCMHGMTSSGKTVPFQICYKPLQEIQKDYDQTYLEQERDREMNRERMEVTAEGELQKQYREERLPDIIIRDAHIATLLRTILPDNPKGVTKEADEFLEWINGMNKQNGQEGIDEQVYLTGWNGGAYRGVRAGRQKFVIPRVFINVIGGVQPEITYKLFKNDRDVTGFIFRILFATAEPRIALPDTTWTMPQDVEEGHRKCIHSMYKGLTVYDSFQEPRVVELNHEAAKMHHQWKRSRAIDINKMDDAMAKNIHAGILGKISEYALRFAGLLAVSDLAYEGLPFATHIEIDTDYIERAIKLAEYFYQSAWDVYSNVNTSIIAPVEVLRYAGYVRANWTQQRIGDVEFPNLGDSSKRGAEQRRKKAGRTLKKMVNDYPKVFGAVAK